MSFILAELMDEADVVVVDAGVVGAELMVLSLPPHAANTRAEPRTAVAGRKEI
jgi:hypothetical protein